MKILKLKLQFAIKFLYLRKRKKILIECGISFNIKLTSQFCQWVVNIFTKIKKLNWHMTQN